MEFEPLSKRLTTIRDRGYSAYRNGEPIENCPYIEDSHTCAWEAGWLLAQMDDMYSLEGTQKDE